jgi:hypothetical protein
MAASRPTRPLLQEARVIDFSNENLPGYFLLLEMAFQAKRRVAFIQQSLVYRPVRRMADQTTLAHCLVFIYKRAALLRVTFEASFVSAHKSKATGFERLLNICRRAFDRDSFVRLVTIRAAHFPFQHWMMVR